MHIFIGCYVEASDILFNENHKLRPANLQKFKTCIGVVHLNSDAHLARKLKNNDFYDLDVREELVGLAIKWEGSDWLHVGKLEYMYDPELGVNER